LVFCFLVAVVVVVPGDAEARQISQLLRLVLAPAVVLAAG